MNLSDIVTASVGEMARALRTGEIRAEALIAAHLERINAVNPHINAVFQLQSDRALQQARRIDRQREAGAKLPMLAGVPYTIKDSFDTADIITTAGTLGRLNYRPPRDATIVTRLANAGAILLGKSNTSELTLSFETDNLVYGRTNNPYDVSRTPGGSSGGGAAIVACGGAAFDIGSDTSGSLRVPAHFCGLASLKPTAGRVPRTGHIIADERTQIGPMARYVADLPLILSLIHGADGIDIMPADTPPPFRVPKKLRIAYFTDNGICDSDSATKQAIYSLVNHLASQDYRLIEDRPSGIDEIQYLRRREYAWIEALLAESGTSEVHHELSWIRAPTQKIRGLEATELATRSEQFCVRMSEFMQAYDAIICPVRPYPALRHGQSGDEDVKPGRWFTPPFNLSGWPVVTVRVGTSPEGLPIGIQIAANLWREDIAIKLALQIEAWSGGWRPPSLVADL